MLQNLFPKISDSVKFVYFMSAWRDRVGDLTLIEALTGGAFDRLNWQHSGEFDQNFSKKSNAPGFAWEGVGWFWN